MICGKCGRNIGNASACQFCGNDAGEWGVENKIPVYGVSEKRKMKWYKFLIYFSLFLSAFSLAMTAIALITGNYWGNYPEIFPEIENIYQNYNVMRYVDIAFGIVQLGMAVYCIMVRQALAGFKKQGPMMLYILYGVNQIVLTMHTVISESVILNVLDCDMVISNVIVAAIIIWINVVYFRKRADMFVQ